MKAYLVIAAAAVLSACSPNAPARPPATVTISGTGPAPVVTPPPVVVAPPVVVPAPVPVPAFSAALLDTCSFVATPGTDLKDLWSVLLPSEKTALGAAGLVCGALITPTTPLNSYYPGSPLPVFVRGSMTIVARS